MKKERYIKITNFFKKNKIANKWLVFIYKILPILIFLSYPLLLVWSFLKSATDFWITLLMPAGMFVLVTVLRVIINEKRPYEKYGTEPVFLKDTKGKSMPSRHTASAFIISMAALRMNVTAGIILLAISCLITISRVLAGVHYVRDVAVSVALSVGIASIVLIIF